MRSIAASGLAALAASAAPLAGAPAWLAGALAGIALLPLAELLVDGLAELAARAPARAGIALRAVAGSGPHVLLGVMAIRHGLPGIVRSSITGALLTSLLLALGVALVAGGARHGRQYFNREQAAMASTLLAIAAVALGLPTLVARLGPAGHGGSLALFSELVAGVMLVLFALALHHGVTHADDGVAPLAPGRRTPRGGPVRAGARAALGAVGTLVLGDRFFADLPEVVGHLGIAPMMVGIVALPLVGTLNALLDGIAHAWRDRVDLTLSIALGAGLRGALLVGPLLVFASVPLGRPMDLVFPPLELAALAAAVGITTLVAHDGQSNWLEGAMLVGVWGMLAAAFFFWPT